MLTVFMLVSAALGLSVGFGAALPFWLAVALLALYGATTMTDSASLTVGAVNAAAAERRGITMAVHSTFGSLTSFLSPLASGPRPRSHRRRRDHAVLGRLLRDARRRRGARPLALWLLGRGPEAEQIAAAFRGRSTQSRLPTSSRRRARPDVIGSSAGPSNALSAGRGS